MLCLRNSPMDFIFKAVRCPPECSDGRIEPTEHARTKGLVGNLRVDGKVEASFSPEEALESDDIIRQVVQDLKLFPSPISNWGGKGIESTRGFQSSFETF